MNWPTLPLDPGTTVFTVGLLFTLMPLTLWTILRGRHDARRTGLWCVGATLSGLTYLLFGLRASLPSLALLQVANAISYTGYAMRWSALRLERDGQVRAAPLAALVALVALVYAYLATFGPLPRLLFNFSVLAFASTAIAHEARCLARETDSRSARMVALTYVLLTVALLLRIVSLLIVGAQSSPTSIRLDVALVLATGILTALWGNVGYLGVAMEHAQRLEGARRAELAAATARSEQAERQAAALKALSDERQELLRVISHEVRQPIHNAQAVLQGVETALRAEQPESEAAGGRVERARGVLRQITASLDNTLAASTLLVSDKPASLRDTDVDMLLELSVGDLPPAGQARVHIARDAEVRTAAMDVGLMRLALRNLLNNALSYAGASSPVTLRVTDSDDPLAVVFEVIDEGPGIAPDLLGKVFDRGTRGRHDQPGQGLGLYIVQLAMSRQRGHVDVRSGAKGTVFTLVLPQGLEPA